MSTDEPRAYCEQCKRRHPPHEHAAFDDDAEVSCGRELSAVRLELQAAVRERDQYRDALERVADSYAPLSQDDMGIARAALSRERKDTT